MQEFDYSKVKDPGYFADHRIKPHSDHKFYASFDEVISGESSFTYNLNGLWKFHYAENYESTIKGFEKEEYDCKAWRDIRVPAHIQMEGYDAPQYVNVQYPWDGREEIEPGEIPSSFNPVASYVKYFTLPWTEQGERIYICFQGAESGMSLWLNGNFAGYSEDSFTPSEFELTPFLKTGENKLAVQVFKWTAGSWCEDQDFFRFSGIFRDVYLYRVPNVHIYDLKIQTLLDNSFTAAKLCIDATAVNQGKVCFTLMDGEHIRLKEEAALEETGHYQMDIEKPELWSAEVPKLYDLLIEVKDVEGQLQEVIPQKVGFRRFEIRDSLMLLNGKRIVFKGVNRHEFSSVSGRHVTEKEMEKDVITMKRNNINAIRTSHYPNDSRLYSLCDQYGIYIMDEANLETHGSWDPVERKMADLESVIPGDKPQWLSLILDRANSMYQRDKNHPCVLIWSCGNESYGGKNIHEMSELLRRLDSSRLVHYEGVSRDPRYPDTSDIESRMYSPVTAIGEFLSKNRKKPFICCEYAHAMGNSCGAMHKYTELPDKDPLYQGGFLWDYIDQSIDRRNRYGEEFQAYGGDFGDRPCDYNFCGNGIAYAGDRKPSPKMQEVKYNYQSLEIKIDKITAEIRNKNLFINTKIYDCFITLHKNGKLIKEVTMETDIPPLTQRTYTLPIEEQMEIGEYAVTVSFRLKEKCSWADAGYEIAFGQGIYMVNQKDAEDTPQEIKSLKVIHGKWNIGIRGEHFEALFSYLNGGLVSYRYGGTELIKTIPKPNFWRAPTDNDRGNNMPCRYAQWKIASMYLSHKKDNEILPPVLEEQEGCAVIKYTYMMPTTPESNCELTYTVHGDGTVAVRLTYDPVRKLGDMPEFGMIFKFDAAYDQVEWYGLGPEDSYWDRKKGARLGIYHNEVSENLASYLVPQECGNKTEVRYAKVMDRKGRGMIFSGETLNFSALPFTPHELENVSHAYELPRVHYTVVRVSKQQMGIGGDDSWGAKTHEEYLIDISKKLEFKFSFKGI